MVCRVSDFVAIVGCSLTPEEGFGKGRGVREILRWRRASRAGGGFAGRGAGTGDDSNGMIVTP